jgi:serine protease Do
MAMVGAARFAGTALALLAGAAGAQDALTPEALFERLAPSVWTVETVDAQGKPLGLGSAVVLGPGSLVTNCHVLAKAKAFAVARENVSYGATLEHADPERDLCLLKVRNFTAPAVTIGRVEDVKVGARVYAIGSPRGLEQTISDGLLSGVRKSADGGFQALQVTVPISPGSSGGGLFDARGRLIGITTFMLKESQNLNFAMPAHWIAEVPERSQARVAVRAELRSGVTAAGNVHVYEYELRDRLTGKVRKVTWRKDQADGDAGDYSQAMPPGGWVAREPKAGDSWDMSYKPEGNWIQGMKLRARVVGEAVVRVKERELVTWKVEFAGYTERGSSPYPNNPGGRYAATAWFAPDLGRIVRFEVRTRGGLGGGAFIIDEQMTLVDVRTE